MESLSDIETELRTLSQSSKYCELQPTVSGKPISFYFAEIADRIKAAAPTTEKSSAVGNAAATREALEAMNRIDTRGLKRLLCELVEADIFDGGQINKTISAVEKARRALSAPPRNCDLFGGDPKMLRTAWFDWSGSPSGRNPDGTVKLTFGEWLIATATGENKA